MLQSFTPGTFPGRSWLPALLVVLGLLPAARAAAQAPNWDWATTPGVGFGSHTVVDRAGNVYVAGSFTGTATFGATTLTSAASSYDVFVAKLNPTGTYQWAVGVGSAEYEFFSDLAVDPRGNVYVTGNFRSDSLSFGPHLVRHVSGDDVFVAKLSAAGAWEWATAAGGYGTDAISSIAVGRTGEVYVTGAFESRTATFGSTTLTNATYGPLGDVFVARLSAAGAWQWAVSAGGLGSDIGAQLTTDYLGDVYVTGSIGSNSVAFGATVLSASRDFGGYDVFVAKLNPAGTWQWAVNAGGHQNDNAHAIAVDGAGNAYVAGVFRGDTATFGTTMLPNQSGDESHCDVFVAKLSAAGAWQWAVSAGGIGFDDAHAVAVDRHGDAYIVGAFEGTTTIFGATTLTATGPAFSHHTYVAKLTTAGAWTWATSLDGPGADVATGLCLDADGYAYVTGWFGGPTATFGTTTLPNAGVEAYTMFLARLHSTLVDPPTLYPNPAHHTATLTDVPATPVTVHDLYGRTVRTAQVPASGTLALPLENLPAGTYLVRAGPTTKRLVVE